LLETFWRGFEAEEDEMVRRGEEGMKLLVGPRLPSPEQRKGEFGEKREDGSRAGETPGMLGLVRGAAATYFILLSPGTH